jgi:hypothetical protein
MILRDPCSSTPSVETTGFEFLSIAGGNDTEGDGEEARALLISLILNFLSLTIGIWKQSPLGRTNSLAMNFLILEEMNSPILGRFLIDFFPPILEST